MAASAAVAFAHQPKIVSKPPRDSGRLVWKIRAAVVVVVDTAVAVSVAVAVAVDMTVDTAAGKAAGMAVDIDPVAAAGLVGWSQAGLRIRMEDSGQAAGD